MRRFRLFFGSGSFRKYSDYMFVAAVIVGLIYELNGCRTDISKVGTDANNQKTELIENSKYNNQN